MNYRLTKKTQITSFIIIGLVIILAVIIFLFVNNSMKQKKVSTEVEVSTENLDASVVKNFVSSCISMLGREAFVKLGEHGGYIDLYNKSYYKKSLKFIPGKPTESDAVSLIPYENYPIVYWWYLRSRNDCSECYLDTKVPTLREIQHQVEIYISSNLYNCIINSPMLLERKINLKPLGKPNTTVTISSKDVVIDVNYPIKVSDSNKKINLNNFNVVLDLGFKEIYELATRIMYLESAGQFLEYSAMNLISLHSGLNSNQLPPIADVDSGYSTTTWQVPVVKENIRMLLSSYIPLIQFNSTKNARPIEVEGTPYQKKIYQSLFFNQINGSFPEIKANVLFLDWPFYFDITPKSGNVLKPSVYIQEFPFNILPKQQTNYYEFFYDLSFPVIVELYQTKAFKERGYTFMFALEANIRDNKDLYDWYHGNGSLGITPVYLKASASAFGVIHINCTQIGNKWRCPETGVLYNNNITCYSECHSELTIVNQTGISSEQSLFCNENQRLSGNITIKTFDKRTKKPVDNVDINFNCGGYRSCNIGRTSLKEHGLKSTLETRLPICIGGFLTFNKEGYAPKAVPLDTNYAKEDYVEAGLMPVHKIKAKIMAKPITDALSHSCCGSPETTNYSFRYIIDIEKIRNPLDPYDLEFGKTYMINGNESFEIEVFPGNFSVDIIGSYKGEAYIEPEAFGVVERPEQRIRNLPVSRAVLNSKTLPWRVPDNIYDYNNSIFYVISAKIPSTNEELNQLAVLENYSLWKRDEIEPDLS